MASNVSSSDRKGDYTKDGRPRRSYINVVFATSLCLLELKQTLVSSLLLVQL